MIDTIQLLIIERLEALFKDKLYKTHNAEGVITKVALRFHEQVVPENKYESDADEHPFVAIKILDGAVPRNGDNLDSSVQTFISIGLYDNEAYKGQKDMLNIINKILNDLTEQPKLKNFEVSGNMEWAIVDEDYAPYFYGGVKINWSYRTTELQRNEFS